MKSHKQDYNFANIRLNQAIIQENIVLELWVFKKDALEYLYTSYERQAKAYFDFIIDFALFSNEHFFFWSSIWPGDKKEIAFKERCRHYSYKEAFTVVRKHESYKLIFSLICSQNENCFYEFSGYYFKHICQLADFLLHLYNDKQIQEINRLLKKLTTT